MKRLFGTAAAAAAALLAAVPVAAQSVAVQPAAPAEAPAPMPPAGSIVGFVPPPRDAGGYRTPNRDLAPEEAVWHVRAALNVAALGCRGAADGRIAAAYNALLDAERAALDAAAAATRARYRDRHGPAWEARFDDDMTRLYNYWAEPAAHDGLCATADALLREAAAVPPPAFAAFAAAALARLEAPFTAFFADYDGYRDALAAWRRDHAPAMIATAAPVPVGPDPRTRAALGPDAG